MNYILKLHGLSDRGEDEGSLYLKADPDRSPGEALSVVPDMASSTVFEDPNTLFEIACLFSHDRWATGLGGPVYAGFQLLPVNDEIAITAEKASLLLLKLKGHKILIRDPFPKSLLKRP